MGHYSLDGFLTHLIYSTIDFYNYDRPFKRDWLKRHITFDYIFVKNLSQKTNKCNFKYMTVYPQTE